MPPLHTAFNPGRYAIWQQYSDRAAANVSSILDFDDKPPFKDYEMLLFGFGNLIYGMFPLFAKLRANTAHLVLPDSFY